MEEHTIALKLKGCAGFLIAPTAGASAAHCQQSGKLKSGIALWKGLPSDGQITRTLERGNPNSSKTDYWIFEIRWLDDQLPEGMRFVPFIQRFADEVTIGPNEIADRIFTLGFPADLSNGKLIFAFGFGKTDGTQGTLINNISLINGNSGGGIFRSEDEMLVSIVSGGPHAFGESGWKDNDWNDSSHWNWGPALWKIYEKSDTLKDIFPNGKNKYVD